MNITLSSTVKDLAIARPEATRLFEKLGIDYCCGGQRTLAEACQKANIKLEDLLDSLDNLEAQNTEAASNKDWREASLTTLANHLVTTHHEFTKDELARIELLINKVCRVHGKNHPELLQLKSVFTEFKDELITHLLKEEQVLFPYLLQLEDAAVNSLPAPLPFFRTVKNPVAMMASEHDQAAQLLLQMRNVTNEYQVPADACFSYRALYQALPALEMDLHQHIHLENNLLFPRAIELEAATFPGSQNVAGASCEHHCFSR